METSTPSVGKVVTMVLFALSCVGLLLYLWLSFGGEVPFNPRGYRFEVAFRDAQQVATQADVRIAGVSVGKVISKTLDPNGNRTLVLIQLDNKYAPIHKDATAILRTKTLLGETYVQLTPGSRFSPALPDNGILPRAQVQPAVQLDQIFNAFDPTTRRAFQAWQQQLAVGTRGNDINLNNVFGNLPTFAADANDILTVLDVEHAAVVNLVRGGATVFGALSQNQSALRNLITSSHEVFGTTANNQALLADVIRIFPTFLDQSRLTMARLRTFSLNTDPLIKELIPVAHNLTPTVQAVRRLSPPLKHLFVNLNPLIRVSKTGMPAVEAVLRGLGCSPQPGIACSQSTLLPALGSALEQVNPILNWLGLHQQLLSDFISNGGTPLSALTTTNTFGGSGVTCRGVPCAHYLRQFGLSGPETLGIYQNRDPNNRGNDYPNPLFGVDPRWLVFDQVAAWDCNNAGGQHGPQGDQPNGSSGCWIAPPLGRFIHRKDKFPHVLQARYPGT